MDIGSKLDTSSGVVGALVVSLASLKDRDLGAEEWCGVDQGGGGECGDKRVEKHGGGGDERETERAEGTIEQISKVRRGEQRGPRQPVT